MGTAFNSAQAQSVSSTGTVIYTAGVGVSATNVSLLLSNTGSSSTTATVTLTNGTNVTSVVTNLTIGIGQTQDISSKIVIKAGAYITVSSPGQVDATISVVENS